MIELFGWIWLAICSITLIAGALFSIVGGWGIVKLPDFYSRLHSAGVTDTAGAALILLGLMLHSGFNLDTLKLMMILFFFMMVSPSACHALAKSALKSGLQPELDAPTGKVRT